MASISATMLTATLAALAIPVNVRRAPAYSPHASSPAGATHQTLPGAAITALQQS